ncbi:hypothetical protein [Amycolatopsis suaedae]|uniref:hypothetical protein n=1 Tax=Amycolatopsis suaedae TaxID=2510978 RepID=UPI001F0E03A3|nr:hypothetical protein [Amycolatopsis suaedae]
MRDLHFTFDVGDDRTRTVGYTGTIKGRPIEETAVFRLDDDGLIAEATLYIRPLTALVTVMATFGPDIARRNGRPWAARLLSVLTAPLVWVVSQGDRRLVSLAAPR